MIRALLLLTLLAVTCGWTVAQTPANDTGSVDMKALLAAVPGGPLAKDPGARRLEFRTTGMYDANTLRNDLVEAMYRGGDVDRSVIDRTNADLRDRNRAGAVFTVDLHYTFSDSIGKRSWRPRIAVLHRSFFGTHFRSEAFQLAFYGNRAHEDRTLALGPGAFTSMSYQGIGFGLGFRGRSHVQMNLLNGQGLHAGRITRADLYTAPFGQYLDLDLQGNYQRSDTAQRGLGSRNGIGLSWSGAYEWRLASTERYQRAVLFEVDDLGFIAWNDQALSAEGKGPIHYDGIAVTDILDLDGPLVAPGAIQDTLGLGYEKGPVILPLPALFRARMEWLRGPDEMIYQVAMDMRLLPGYLPHVEVARRFIVGRTFRPEVRIGHGGFGGLRVGVGAGLRLGGRTQLRVDTPNLVGTVLRTGHGQGVSLGLCTSW